MANISMANDKQLVQTNRQTASEIKIFLGRKRVAQIAPKYTQKRSTCRMRNFVFIADGIADT